MKIILKLFIIMVFSINLLSANEINCETALQKLKPKCNLIGKGMNKMRDFSKKNKTLDQSIGNVKDKFKKK